MKNVLVVGGGGSGKAYNCVGQDGREPTDALRPTSLPPRQATGHPQKGLPPDLRASRIKE